MSRRACRWWTPERVAELERLWRQDVRCAEIAARLGAHSPKAVQSTVWRLGISKRSPRRPGGRPAHLVAEGRT